MNAFFRSKTNWTAIIAAITALSAYLTGDIEGATAIQSGFAALVTIFMRHGVEKSGSK